jgi:hypothetical protein
MTGQWPAPSRRAATQLKVWPTPKLKTRESFSTSARSAFDGAAPQTAVCGARPLGWGPEIGACGQAIGAPSLVILPLALRYCILQRLSAKVIA